MGLAHRDRQEADVLLHVVAAPAISWVNQIYEVGATERGGGAGFGCGVVTCQPPSLLHRLVDRVRRQQREWHGAARREHCRGEPPEVFAHPRLQPGRRAGIDQGVQDEPGQHEREVSHDHKRAEVQRSELDVRQGPRAEVRGDLKHALWQV